MLVRLSTRIFENLDNVNFFIKKLGIFKPKQVQEIAKNIGLQAISLPFELVSSSIEVFWVLLMINAGIFILLYSI